MQRRLERLRREGFSEAELQRIRGPIGLDIGARSPAEIAIAILAQMTAELRNEGRHKKSRAVGLGGRPAGESHAR